MKTFDINNIQLNIQSPGVTIDGQLQDYLISHIEKLGKKYSRIKKCDLVLHTEKNKRSKKCVAEAKLFVPNEILFAKEQDESFKIAARNLFDDLHSQLHKYKEKIEG